MSDPLGVDFSLRAGLDGRLTSGRALLAESLARRLRTRRGALWYDPSYGSYLPDYLGEGFADGGAEAAALCEIDLEEDPRVRGADVTVVSADLERITLRAQVDTLAGPITLVVEAARATDVLPGVVEAVPYGVG